jgi:ribonuclease HI
MKKELKQTIFETVSTFRKLIVKLTNSRDSKTSAIVELEARVSKMKAEIDACGSRNAEVHGAPSLTRRQEQAGMTARDVAPSDGRDRKLYSEALGREKNVKLFKLTVTAKGNQSADTIKGLLKSKINPTEIKVEINTFKSLKNGKVLIETNSKEEIEVIEKDINAKYEGQLEANIHKLRNQRLVIFNIPEYISTGNLEDTLIAQNPELNLKKGDINARFSYVTKKQIWNMVMEVGAQTRKLLLQKVKLGWLLCKIEDYLLANRCFKYSRFNHRFSECRGEETCPLCAESHKLEEFTASPTAFLTGKNKKTSTLQIFTNGSKSEQGVGAGVAIFKSGNHIKSLQYKLNKRCTNNQAEQLAILRALEYTENLQTEDKTATVYTDSRMTLDSLKNSKIHTFLIEEIRRKLTQMEKINWKIQLCWVKAHVGIQGNELADTLAKEAATSTDIMECYKKFPKSVVRSELGEKSVEKWQRDWDQTTKGQITKEYFPIVADRLNIQNKHYL